MTDAATNDSIYLGLVFLVHKAGVRHVLYLGLVVVHGADHKWLAQGLNERQGDVVVGNPNANFSLGFPEDSGDLNAGIQNEGEWTRKHTLHELESRLWNGGGVLADLAQVFANQREVGFRQ